MEEVDLRHWKPEQNNQVTCKKEIYIKIHSLTDIGIENETRSLKQNMPTISTPKKSIILKYQIDFGVKAAIFEFAKSLYF